VGLRPGLDEYEISRPPPGFDPWAVHPLAIRYTDCAVPVRLRKFSLSFIYARTPSSMRRRNV